MFTTAVYSGVIRLRDSITSWLVRTRIRPNTLTVVGLILNVPVAVLIGLGYLVPAAAAFVFASLFDVLDGSLAKAGGRATKFGGFLDSTLDRISDMFLFGGVAAYFHSRTGDDVFAALTLVALAFSLLISYTRARAECEIPECTAGIAQRPERILILIVACLLNSLPAAIVSLVILTAVTFLSRVVYTWYSAEERSCPRIWQWVLLDFPRGSRAYDVVMLAVLALLVAGSFFLRPPVFP